MSLLLWGRETNGLRDRLQESLRTIQCSTELMTDMSIHGLRRRLLDCRPEIEALVLCPQSTQELMALIELRPLLAGLRLIVLLPDDAETIALAHRLRPRYVAAADSAACDLAAVLLNLLRHDADARRERIQGE